MTDSSTTESATTPPVHRPASQSALAAAAAQRRGVTQYVVLGAGLDSYAYRVAAPGCTVFEVDHPRSQQDKRARVAAAGLSARSEVAYIPVDFETDALIP